MTKVLVLCPMKPNLHRELKSKARELLARLPDANPTLSLEIVVDERGAGDSRIKGLEERVAHTAKIRQALIDEYLKPETDYVLWVDADIVDYPANLPTELITRGEGNVSAPFVYLDNHGERFYDVAGFVYQGKWFKLLPPYCPAPGPIYSLEGVGCLVLFPALVYRSGGKHEPCKGFTDWLGVCKRARELGYKVLAFRELKAYHADLIKFGERYH